MGEKQKKSGHCEKAERTVAKTLRVTRSLRVARSSLCPVRWLVGRSLSKAFRMSPHRPFDPHHYKHDFATYPLFHAQTTSIHHSPSHPFSTHFPPLPTTPSRSSAILPSAAAILTTAADLSDTLITPTPTRHVFLPVAEKPVRHEPEHGEEEDGEDPEEFVGGGAGGLEYFDFFFVVLCQLCFAG